MRSSCARRTAEGGCPHMSTFTHEHSHMSTFTDSELGLTAYIAESRLTELHAW